jgi:decaprenylphospho-beta-D-ribofuranose 2-oxidase
MNDLSTLTGWGGTSPSSAHVVRPVDVDALRGQLATAGPRGVIVRGLGRSYGDPAQNAGGTVIDLTNWDAILDVDSRASAVRVQAGISLDRLLRALLPLGLWLPVVPGTRQVTVGGAIAADVHGKNHHMDGSFGNHVSQLDILLGSGDIVSATPEDDKAELFWATVGGMGLTGVVLEATIELKEVETSYFVVDTQRTRNLAELLSALSDGDDDYTYSVAWFDTATTGDALGRAVITRGNTALREELNPAQRGSALRFAASQHGRVPFALPMGLVTRPTARAFNALWYAKAPRHRMGEVQDITQFFHPLDVVGDWNRVYGPHGFCQYQFVVPFSEEAAFTTAVETLAQSGHVSSLNVLKRFGPGNASPMSFPMPGWTLAVDLPVRPGLDTLLSHLDQLVVAAGGRIYLAKDSRAAAATIARMYPRLQEFRATRAHYDPDRIFRSDLSRRLDL